MATGRQVRGSGVSLARVRRWLLAGVVLLLAVLAGLLGYARYRAHRFMSDLPKKLGLDIKSETDGFTVSQSVKDRKIFTLHAAKAIQHENGKTTLHNVAITLFGPPGSNRTDSIRGDDFEYDQPNGVISAVGDVHLDLASPAQPNAAAKDRGQAAKRIAVTTHGLVYLQKLGVAATDQPLQILYGDLHGSAVGADYDSDQGMLRLKSDVHMDGTQDGKALHVVAGDAQLDRTAQTALMHAAHVQSGDARAAGDTVTLHLAKDGGVEAIQAEGHASVGSPKGLQADAARLDAHMTPAGKLQTATMGGGVRFGMEGGGSGSAENALLHFDPEGRPVQVDLLHAVQVNNTGASGEQDRLTADRVIAHLVQDGRRSALHDAVATGAATLQSIGPTVTKGKPGVGMQQTVVHADELRATTAVTGKGRYIDALDGNGSTRIEQTSSTGEVRTGSGDTLHATLRPPGSKAADATDGQLQTAVQTGHVVVTQHVPAKPAASNGGSATAAQDTRATAQHAEFDNATQRLILTGAPVVTAPGVQLAANRVVLAQGSGNTEATGDVRGTFVQPDTSSGSPDPVHVLAERAVIAGAAGAAQFFGGGRPARMWSTTAQLDAPELDLDRTHGTLAAHGGDAGSADGSVVHLTLPPAAKGSAASRSGTVQMSGRQLTMTAATAAVPGQLVMSGQARMRTAVTTVTAGRITAVLHADAKKQGVTGDAGANLLNNGIDSVTATDNVVLQQPGRTGTGAKLLYTAADERYQLTGTPSSPPRISDSVRGNVTGASLIFHGEDDSVEVAGEPGRRVHTETDAGRGERSR